jgi:hypothetical protein
MAFICGAGWEGVIIWVTGTPILFRDTPLEKLPCNFNKFFNVKATWYNRLLLITIQPDLI